MDKRTADLQRQFLGVFLDNKTGATVTRTIFSEESIAKDTLERDGRERGLTLQSVSKVIWTR